MTDTTTHDFDPSGDEHPGHCMCPCCDLVEEEVYCDKHFVWHNVDEYCEECEMQEVNGR